MYPRREKGWGWTEIKQCSGAERPRWVDYEHFEEDVDDNGDGGFKDETIGHREGFRQSKNRRDFVYFDEVFD